MLKSSYGKTPRVHENTYIAESAQIIGDVEMAEGSSVWPNAVIRGDLEKVRIGRFTNVQDVCVVHVDRGKPTNIGDYVTIGHGAIIHGCTIGNGALIGMGAIVMDGAEVGEGALVAAGAVIPPGKKVPPGVLMVGSPAKQVRELSEREREELIEHAKHYAKLWQDDGR